MFSFFFNDTATTEIYTLSLHDALPISDDQSLVRAGFRALLDAQPDIRVVGEAADGEEALKLTREAHPDVVLMDIRMPGDRKSTRLNSSHANISYAVFCLKKKHKDINHL